MVLIVCMKNEGYETDQMLSDYLGFHFASASKVMPWQDSLQELADFPVRTTRYFEQEKGGRSLDLGCAVGRSSWELSLVSDSVIGIDFSHIFINAAHKMRDEGRVSIAWQNEGREMEELVLEAPRGNAETLHFEQGDAMNLRPDLGSFRRVHASNLICRLPQPELLLKRLPELVESGGELVLATPFSWLEEYTPKDHWPKGDSFQWLTNGLDRSFELIETNDEPFLIREHARKYQLVFSKVSYWRRR